MTYCLKGIRGNDFGMDEAPARVCACVGPQPGYPRCPCQMQGLIQRDGRWIEPERDLGPVARTLGEKSCSG